MFLYVDFIFKICCEGKGPEEMNYKVEVQEAMKFSNYYIVKLIREGSPREFVKIKHVKVALYVTGIH